MQNPISVFPAISSFISTNGQNPGFEQEGGKEMALHLVLVMKVVPPPITAIPVLTTVG
jgi:hypothetical protein